MSGLFLLSPDVADVPIMVVQRLELCHFFIDLLLFCLLINPLKDNKRVPEKSSFN